MADYVDPSVLFVVPDRFACFAENSSVATVSSLTEALRIRAGAIDSTPVQLHPGLGIDPDTWAHVIALLSEHGMASRAIVATEPPRKVSRHEVLKLNDENVLLGNLINPQPRQFTADLVMSTATEMILDHTAERQHIPGMLLMEACCQMLIGATRRFLRIERPGTEYYAVMQQFSIDFSRFVFPLPASLDMTIDTWDDKDIERPTLTCTIKVLQSGDLNARARWKYRAFRPQNLFHREARQARTAIATQTTAIEKGSLTNK